jgi:hypothetical protein
VVTPIQAGWTLTVMLMAAVGNASAAPPAPAAIPTVVSAGPAEAWNAKFEGTLGWVGGDGAYSAVMGEGRVLWLFGDTLIGAVRDGTRAGSAMVNNTVAVQAGLGPDADIRFVNRTTGDGKPAALFPPGDGQGWVWTQAAARAGDRLFVFLPQLEKTGEPGAFGFRHVAQWLAIVDNPDEAPDRWRVRQLKMPFAEFGAGATRSWGSAVFDDGESLYVYGYAERGGNAPGAKELIVARAPRGRLDDFAAWRFRTADAWSADPADSAPLARGLASELSVSRTPGGDGFVAVYTENGLGPRIVARFAPAPDGPWSEPVLLYTCPEMSRDRGVFTYSAKAHPWAAVRGDEPDGGGDELLVSYCTNTWDFAGLFRDAAVYRPKFVRVRFAAAAP